MINAKTYQVSFEVEGPMAIFTRPDSGATFVSYPAPTFSALRGMFDCVAWLKTAYIRPTKVEICRPIQFQRYATNYGGALRKAEQARTGSSYQLFATVLVDVCYRVHGEARGRDDAPEETNHLHYLQEKFNRRLKQGRLYRTPCLGWSEFTPSYFGPLREGTKCLDDLQIEIPSMLHSVFDRESRGAIAPQFRQNLRVESGVLHFAQ
ncbi:MAG: CRISPR-associated protein Cas5 [Bryobacterales bacterium]|nr:CRISPR-associated protein Cas5 [Bryobacterales bacterium]